MARLILSDGTQTVVTPEADSNEWTLVELQRHLQGYIEHCPAQYDGHEVWVNEEGRLNGMHYNSHASSLTGQDLVGPVLILDKDEHIS
jgi:hypothetical protein|tara:strand:- start:282 stop:545 length:264 start_codon:yes stop_codon:yes gene_type:complete